MRTFPYSGRYTCTSDAPVSTSLAIHVANRPISRTDFFRTRDASSRKSPLTLARTPSAVVESIDKSVGVNTAACSAYPLTATGTTNPNARIARSAPISTTIATMVGHRRGPSDSLSVRYGELSRDAGKRDLAPASATYRGRSSSRRCRRGVDSDDKSKDLVLFCRWSDRSDLTGEDDRCGDGDLDALSSRGALESSAMTEAG